MKRHLVMDLFHGHLHEPVGDWIDSNQLPQLKQCKVKVKLADGSEDFAYFYSDKAPVLGEPTHHFWHCSTKDYIPIESITHWKYLKNE